MRTYTFFYILEEGLSPISYQCRAERLKSALKLFRTFDLQFVGSDAILLPNYEVVNDDGKRSSRLLPFKYMNEDFV